MEVRKYDKPLKYILKCTMMDCQTGRSVDKHIVEYMDGTTDIVGNQNISVNMVDLECSKRALKEE